ncbi:hypothetical protein [Arthrobacter sp. NPDC080082]|uniref:hypothetical protein n=1 Tax=Arthrobacter sp. NPDC080082 TaxID=3155916 RepID=UPI003413AFDB
MGDLRSGQRLRFVGVLALVLSVLGSAAACGAEPRQPDLSTREAFARSVMDAAVSGSAERVAALASPAVSNAAPEAQQLVDSTRGWAAGSWQLGISNDFPEVANVTARHVGDSASVRYMISWSDERWTLAIGEPKNRPSGGANPIGPGTNPKFTPSGTVRPSLTPTPPAACTAASLACHSYTSTAGYARGKNMSWLASSPLRMSFDQVGAATTLVIRMPCGVLNVPVSVDDFGLVPDPASMAESADGCAGPEGEHRSWTSDYFQHPAVYRLDAGELVLTNDLGQIRFKQD